MTAGTRQAPRPIEVLIVDDSEADSHLTTTALRDARIANDVRVVEDGDQAMAFLHREGSYLHAPRPDLILLDLNLPIQGYDPVAYFTDSRPVKGDSKFSYTWRGGVWQFASAQHKDLFTQNPEQYAPQYGGYCAYGVGENHTVDIDPEAWKIIDGKLYLNYSKGVQQKFLKEPAVRIKRADQNWPGLHK